MSRGNLPDFLNGLIEKAEMLFKMSVQERMQNLTARPSPGEPKDIIVQQAEFLSEAGIISQQFLNLQMVHLMEDDIGQFLNRADIFNSEQIQMQGVLIHISKRGAKTQRLYDTCVIYRGAARKCGGQPVLQILKVILPKNALHF